MADINDLIELFNEDRGNSIFYFFAVAIREYALPSGPVKSISIPFVCCFCLIIYHLFT